MLKNILKYDADMNGRKKLRSYTLVASVFCALAFAIPTVQAQSSDVQALLDRINRLEADLNNVQRKVYQGQDVPAPTSIVSGNTAIVTGGEGAALLSSRLDVLEEEQRRVTGSLEEVDFNLGKLGSRLDKLILDIDFRLTEIERRQSGLSGNDSLAVNQSDRTPLSVNAQNNESAPSNTQQQRTEEALQSTSSSSSQLAKGSKVLGTLRVPAGSTEPVDLRAANNDASETVAAVSGQPEVTRSPAEQYNHAIALIRNDDYTAAEKAFSEFLEKNKEHALAGNAQYWLGESFYVRGDFANAASAFLNGYQVYPDNTKAADNLLKLAMTLGRMDQKEEACATFHQLDKQFPNLAARLERVEDREKKKFGCK